MAHMARLHREKMRWLLGEIVAGEYEPGELLPPEVVLAERLGVSRGVVREVMRALEERGVVSVRHGSGATVAVVADWNVLDPAVLSAVLAGPDGRTILLELHECRALLEVGAAGLAARRATEGQLAVIEAACERLVAARSREHAARGAAELALHRSVLAAAGNLRMAAMLRPVFEGLEPAAEVLGRRAGTREEHRRIVRAIVARDAEAAELAMRSHFDALAADMRERRGPFVRR
jgi:DNA-binding FadR family transcriptional regulator